MYCWNCGKEINDHAYICPNCGVLANGNTQDAQKRANEQADEGSKVGWGFLSWFVPVAGLILFCIWHADRPKTAKVCGICALVSTIVNTVIVVFFLVFLIFVAGTMGGIMY